MFDPLSSPADIVLTAPQLNLLKGKLYDRLQLVASSLDIEGHTLGLMAWPDLVAKECQLPALTRLIIIDLRHVADLSEPALCHQIEALLATTKPQEIALHFLLTREHNVSERLWLHDFGTLSTLSTPMQAPSAHIRQILDKRAILDEAALRIGSLQMIKDNFNAALKPAASSRLLTIGPPHPTCLGLAKNLSDRGHEVISAFSVHQAMLYLESSPFDGIIYFAEGLAKQFPSLLRLVRRRDRLRHLPAFLLCDEAIHLSSRPGVEGADFIFSEKDPLESIATEISLIARQYSRLRMASEFLAGVRFGERTSKARPLCSRDFFEFHLARQLHHAQQYAHAHALILLQFHVEVVATAGGWRDHLSGIDKIQLEALTYAAMLSEEHHLAGRLDDKLLALSLQDTTLNAAERLRDKIESVLGQMAFRHKGKPYRLSIASAVVQMREDENMLCLLQRARQNINLAKPHLLVSYKAKPTNDKKPPDLTLVQ